MRLKLRQGDQEPSEISVERLAEIEEARGAPVTLEELQLIANTLGMTAWELLRFAEEGETDEQERQRRKPEEN